MDNEERKKVVEVKQCVGSELRPDCKNSFEITQGEKAYFESKGLILPKRCSTCRMARRSSIKTTQQIPID